MAYQQDFSEEEDKAQQGAAPQIGPESSSIGAAPGSSAAPASPSAKSASGFTNLQTYLDANKEAGQGMAQQVAQGAQSDIAAAQAPTQTFTQQAGQRAAEGTTRDTQNIQSIIQNTPQKLAEQGWRDLYSQATKAYSGPSQTSQLEAYAPAVEANKKAQESVASLSDPNKLQAKVQDIAGKQPGYTRGMGLLDTFITTTGKGGETLQAKAKELQGQNVAGQWQKAQEAAQASLQGAQAQSAANAAAVANARAAKEQSYVDLFNRLSQEATGAGKKLGDVAQTPDIQAYEALRSLIGLSGAYDFSKTPAPLPTEPVRESAGMDRILSTSPGTGTRVAAAAAPAVKNVPRNWDAITAGSTGTKDAISQVVDTIAALDPFTTSLREGVAPVFEKKKINLPSIKR